MQKQSVTCKCHWLDSPEPVCLPKTPVELGSVGEIVTCVVAHPKIDVVIVGTASGRIVAWDPARARMTHTMQAHHQEVTRIAFAPDGNRFLTSSIDGNLQLWDQHCNLVRKIAVGTPIYAACYSTTGCEVAVGGEDRSLRVFDPNTGTLLFTLNGHSDAITACQWVTAKTLVSAGAEGHFWAWEPESSRALRRQRPHQLRVSHLLASHDRSWYLSASWDHTIKVWNQQHREKFALPASDQAVTAVAVSENDKRLFAVYWNGAARIWNLETGALIDEFIAHDESSIGCALTAGSKSAVTVSQSGVLRAWNIEDMGVSRFVHRHSGEVYSVAYTPDNVHAISVGFDGQLKVWDRNARAESVAIENSSGPIMSAAVSPDNRLWALGGADGVIRLWDVEQENFDATLAGHHDSVSALQFFPSGDRLVSASWDMKLRIWSLVTQRVERVFDGHNKEVSACDLSLDGRTLASVSWDGTGRVWDLASRPGPQRSERLVLTGHSDRVLCCAISPDGTRVATGSADLSVRIWPIDRLRDPQVLCGHNGAVTTCRYSPDGHLLITGDRNGQIMIWDAVGGKPMGSIQHDRAVLSLAIAPDGAQAILGDEAGQVRFFELQYAVGPCWLAANSLMRSPPLWKRGSPPVTVYEAGCVYCGNTTVVGPKDLGGQWRCRKCGGAFMLCPQAMPPNAALAAV